VDEGQSISFWKAFALPRVALYASCFFCTKMAVYCLLLWLPTFLKGDAQLQYTNRDVANLQSSVDLGAVFGSVALGYISDLLHG
jgi:sugar phosphate permease